MSCLHRCVFIPKGCAPTLTQTLRFFSYVVDQRNLSECTGPSLEMIPFFNSFIDMPLATTRNMTLITFAFP